MKNKKLIQWLRANSSGCYRPSAEAADRFEECLIVINQLLMDLPSKREWLNPDLEKIMRAIIKEDE